MKQDLEAMYNSMFKKVQKRYCEILDISVYFMDVTDLPVHDSYEWMAEDRRNKLRSYHKESDRRLLLGGEMTYLYGLCCENELEVNVENLEKMCRVVRKEEKYGKPYLPDFRNIFFNISHSGRYSVCAFSDAPVGVDVECMNEVYLDVAERFYTAEEYQELILMSNEMQKKLFYEYWVMKESYIKAQGSGMRIPLNSFSFDDKRDGCRKVIHKNHTVKYLTKVIEDFDERYRLAVCKKLNR